MTTPITTSPVVAAVGAAAVSAMSGPLADVVVLDGVDPAQAYSQRSLTIGGTWDPDVEQLTSAETVFVESAESGFGRLPLETTSVACIAYSGGGSSVLADHRASVNAILVGFRDALHALTDVGGSSAQARMTGQQWAQIIDGQGAGVMAMFTVEVRVLP